MKKTIIAAAIATVVAAPAMAEVNISGQVQVDKTYTDSDTTGANQWSSGGDTKFAMTMSEDLGNGMTAFGKIGLDGDSSAAQDAIVGLKGSFGTVQLGRFEDFTKTKMDDTLDVMGASAASMDRAYGANRADGGVAYVSPTVSGFTVALGGYMDNTASTPKGFDATDFYVSYSNGPLTLQASQENVDTTLTGTIDDDNDTETATADRKTNSFTAKYAIGDLSLGLYSGKQENGATDEKTNGAVIAYSMGSNVISIGMIDDDNGSSADYDATAISLKHKLSGRTYATIGMRDANGTNDDTVGFRLHHSF